MRTASVKKPIFPGDSNAVVAPKLLGADFELGNFVMGLEQAHGTGAMASRALLREIAGLPLPRPGTSGSWDESGCLTVDPQDWGRKYLPENGSCVYIDLDHLECCTPETLDAHDFAAAFHAMLRLARTALRTANSRMPDGVRVVAVVNNEDGQGHSYGSHLNVLMTRAGWDRLFYRRLDQLMTLASFQVSSIILTGQGKVNPGSPNGGHSCYELSQRASFFECLVGKQTTYNRPLVNSRDESLCRCYGTHACQGNSFARLHCIFFDATLCPASIVLRTGMMQLMLCLLEADQSQAELELLLEDPVETVAHWSQDPTLTARARLLSGEEVTALDLQRRFFEKAARFVERGGSEGVVPRARDILALWEDTLDKLRNRQFASLAPRLDWVLKLQLLERAMHQRPDLNWSSPELKHLDFKYGDLEEGLFWACQRAGAVESLGIGEAEIQTFTHEPPENTRAWTRAQLLRLAEPDSVAEVDWDKITFDLRSQNGTRIRRTIVLPDPLGFTRRDTEPVFCRGRNLEGVLDLLGAPQRDPPAVNSTPGVFVVQHHLIPKPAEWEPRSHSDETSL